MSSRIKIDEMQIYQHPMGALCTVSIAMEKSPIVGDDDNAIITNC